jgi:hypothetical protein
MVDHMDIQSQSRLLLKILIGVAWLDGEIQPAEHKYLAKVAQAHQLSRDTEVESLLTGALKITLPDCEKWIEEYLGDRSINDDDGLLEAISGLIYSDGDVAVEEAKLLVDIQSVSAPTSSSKKSLVEKIQQLYKQGLGCRS